MLFLYLSVFAENDRIAVDGGWKCDIPCVWNGVVDLQKYINEREWNCVMLAM